MHACACVSADAARFNCENTEVHMGQVNVNLRCEVRARPMMTALFWVIDDNGTTVHEGQRVGQYWTFTNVCSFLFFFYIRYVCTLSSHWPCEYDTTNTSLWEFLRVDRLFTQPAGHFHREGISF